MSKADTDHQTCKLANGPKKSYTVKTCEEVEKNAMFMMAKTRLITTAIESTYMPILQMFSQFHNLFHILQLLQFSNLPNFLYSVGKNVSSVIALVSIPLSIIGLSWQQKVFHFEERANWISSKSTVTVLAYLATVVLQATSRLFAITVRSIVSF